MLPINFARATLRHACTDDPFIHSSTLKKIKTFASVDIHNAMREDDCASEFMFQTYQRHGQAPRSTMLGVAR